MPDFSARPPAAPAGGGVPAWLASRIRRSQISAVLSDLVPVLAVLFLLAAVEVVWLMHGYESILIILFWNVVFLGALYALVPPYLRVLAVLIWPGRSDAVAYLRRFGPLDQTVEQLATEVRFAGAPIGGTDAIFTPNWLVVSGRSRFAARHLTDVRQVFLRTSWVHFHFVIPLWRRRTVVFRSPAAPDAESRVTKAGAEALLAYAARFPSIARGPDAVA
ncbi:MAG: hypothetical protein ACYDAB_08360 [bacterium]